jgi:hypothetical protein
MNGGNRSQARTPRSPTIMPDLPTDDHPTFAPTRPPQPPVLLLLVDAGDVAGAVA